MRIPYRTRRALGRTAIVLAVIALALLLVWLCWLLWLGRYVVYTPDGVRFDFRANGCDAVPTKFEIILPVGGKLMTENIISFRL